MTRIQLWMASLTLSTLAYILPASSESYSGKLLLVSMDGFRWDYLDQQWSRLHNFRKFADEGVRAPYLQNPYATVTFPGHYSIATGLYQETHGIIYNKMYDPVFNSTFDMSNTETRWWEGGEPIWTTAKLQGKKVGTYFWPGTPVVLKGILPDYYYTYNESVPFAERIDTVVDWFQNQNVELATLYFHEPDHTGHAFGPDSQQVKDMVLEMDIWFGYLMDKMIEAGILDMVNIILLSDHGMAVASEDKLIDITEHVDMDLIQTVSHEGTSCNILPHPGKEEEVYQALVNVHPNMAVYRKQDIPDHWHYQNNRRIHPIFVAMDEGYRCQTVPFLRYIGTHGYDNANPAMRAIFLARGPDFKIGYQSNPIMGLDIYGLMCTLMELQPAPNNGTLENILPIIIPKLSPKGEYYTAAATTLQGDFLVVFITLTIVTYVFKTY